MILYSAADLIWASKIKGTAESVGVSARPVRSLEMLEARLADSPVRALVIDLDAPEVGLSMIRRLRGESATPGERAIRVLAFGPHVAVELLQEAKTAGADVVMTRGTFSSSMPDRLRELGTSQTSTSGEPHS